MSSFMSVSTIELSLLMQAKCFCCSSNSITIGLNHQYWAATALLNGHFDHHDLPTLACDSFNKYFITAASARGSSRVTKTVLFFKQIPLPVRL